MGKYRTLATGVALYPSSPVNILLLLPSLLLHRNSSVASIIFEGKRACVASSTRSCYLSPPLVFLLSCFCTMYIAPCCSRFILLLLFGFFSPHPPPINRAIAQVHRAVPGAGWGGRPPVRDVRVRVRPHVPSAEPAKGVHQLPGLCSLLPSEEVRTENKQ